MVGDPHGPNKLSDYIQVHQSAMAHHLAEGFVLQDGTEIVPYGGGLWVLAGDIECTGGLILEVFKIIERFDGDEHNVRVRTTKYRYNARLPGHGTIFRYNSPHQHRAHHHVHRYDVLNGDPEGTVVECEWPSLSKVIEEFRDWYYANYDALRPLLDPGS